jgi:hypothetical protein
MKTHLTERFVKAAEPDPARNINVRDAQRYAHLLDDPIRQGTNAVGEMLRPKLKLIFQRAGAGSRVRCCTPQWLHASFNSRQTIATLRPPCSRRAYGRRRALETNRAFHGRARPAFS